MMQWGIKYAIHIVSTRFGDLAAKICECLFRKGPLSLQNIARFVEIPTKQVKICLVLLVQQNLVQAFTVEDAGSFGDQVKLTEYIVLFDNIIHRTRIIKFNIVVSQELDQGCVDLVEGLLQNGRLTLEQMIDRAKSGKDMTEHSSIENAVRENLSKLAHAHFVEHCPAVEPLLVPLSEEELAARKRAMRLSKMVLEPDTLERVIEAAAPMEAKRFLVISDEIIADAEKTGDGIADIGRKRKLSFLASDSELGIKEDVMWRVNYEEFLRRFRHKACVENARERLDDGAALAFSSMLEASRKMENKLKTETSVPVSINAIYEVLIKAEAGRSMTLDDLRDHLVLLDCNRGADESYSIDLKSILELSQNAEVESIVLNKYGQDAYKIFRLLSKAGHFYQADKIADTVFVEKKETLRILYKLWKDGYLHMEKKSVAVRDKQQTSHFVLWKVNKAKIWKNALDDLYHAALNLSLRMIHDTELGNELKSLPNEELKRLQRIKMVLEASLLQIDDAIMLFHDF